MFSERKIWNDGAPFEDFMGRDGAPPVARRHLAFGGGKGGSGGTTYQTQQTTIPPEVQARYNAVNARAEQVAQQPFQPYQGQFVAPLTATQQAGTAQIANAGQGYQPYQQAATTALTGSAEAALPYYGQAGQNIGAAQAAGAPYTGAATMAGLAGAQSVNPGQLDIGRYMDPYLQSVVAPTMQGLYQQQQQQQSQLMGSQAMRGAFGGDRGSIAAANLARQQGLAAQQAQGGLLSQGYGQALQAAQQQQGVGLGAEQANRAAMQQLSPQLLQIGQQAFQQPMAAAQAQQGLGQGLLGYGQGVSQSLAGLGQMGTQTGLASGQALLGAGTLEQQTQQQLNAALYNQYQQQQGYPFQVAQFLANIAMGTGPLYGSTTSGVTGQPTPFFSDERLKKNAREIGRTHDGQPIYKFDYKNEPDGTSHIGLMAQDVEKHHPEAVSETPEGIKAVDYDMATQHAERAYGGGLMPSSEGGAVHPSMAGLGFASGGTPVPGANPEVDEMLRGLAPRRAFATAGAVTPGVDAYTQQLLQSLVNPMGKTMPHGSFGTRPGKEGTWSPGPPKASPLLKGSLPSLPQQQPTGLSQTIGGVKDAVGAYETGEKLYKGGEKAYNWARKELDRQPSGVSPDGATTGGNKITSTDLPAQPAAAPAQTSGLGAATPTRVADAGSGLAPETAVASLDALPTEDIASLGGLEGLSMFAARGGRIGYNPGGLVGSNPALPYTGGDDDKSIVEDLADDPQKQNKLDAPKLDMRSGDKGGGQSKKDPVAGGFKGAMSGATAGAALGPWGMAGGALLGGLAGALARGGRIGYAEGGGQTFVDRLMPAALKASEKTGVHPHLILAQAALESGWGKHAPGNNYFGIKGPGQVLDTKEQGATGLYNTRDSFRKYESPEHSVDDYANFIMSNSRYRPVREARTLDEQIEAMGRSGYATDRDYTAKLRGIANSLSGNATPFTPSERGRSEAPRTAGLAPPEMSERGGLSPFSDWGMPDDEEEHLATGGRAGYQAGGDPPDDLVLGLSEADLQRRFDPTSIPIPPRNVSHAVPAAAVIEEPLPDWRKGLNYDSPSVKAAGLAPYPYETASTKSTKPERALPRVIPASGADVNAMLLGQEEMGPRDERPPVVEPFASVPPASVTTEANPPIFPFEVTQGAYTPPPNAPAASAPTTTLYNPFKLAPSAAAASAPTTTPAKPPGLAPSAAAASAPTITPANLPGLAPSAAAAGAPAAGAPAANTPANTPTPSSDPDLFDRIGGFLKNNQDWLVPGISGIGRMLASRSPFLGNAVGEGLVEAATAYPTYKFKQEGLDLQKARAAADISRYFSENVTETTVDGKVMFKNKITGDLYTPAERDRRQAEFIRQFLPWFDPKAKYAQGISAAPAAGAPAAGAPAAGAPVAGAPAAGAPAAGAPAAGAPAVNPELAAAEAQLPPNDRPSVMLKDMTALQQNIDSARAAGNLSLADTLTRQLSTIRSRYDEITGGSKPLVGPNGSIDYWYKERIKREQQAAKAGEAEAYAAKLRADASQAEDTRKQLSEMKANFRSLNPTGITSPGVGANERIAMVRGIGTALRVLGAPNAGLDQQGGAAEAVNKGTAALAGALRSALGNHDGAQVFNTMMNATPSINNTPYGFERIVSGMEQALAYKEAKAEFFTRYANKYLNIDDTNAAFARELPVEVFTSRAIVNALPENVRSGLAAYMRDNGALRGADAIVDQKYGGGTAKALRVLLQRGES